MIEIASHILYPFKVPFMATSQIYWLYLLSTILMATLLYIFGLAQWDNQKNFLQFLFPKEVYLHPSAITGYKYYFFSSLCNIFIILPAGRYFLSNFANIICQTLIQITGINAPFAVTNPHLWHHIAFSIFIALIGDFAYFVYHYLSHKVPFWWEFHKVHHSAIAITPMTVYCAHPVDLCLSIILNTTIPGLGIGIWIYFLGNNFTHLLIYGVSVEIFAFYLLGYNLRHSHIWLAYPDWISHIFMSPAQHQIHHSVEPKHYDKNFGYILSFWDWIFGTLYIPHSYEKLDFGLSNGESKLFNTVPNLFLQPFRAIWQRNSKTSV